jgi:hypothetical protein
MSAPIKYLKKTKTIEIFPNGSILFSTNSFVNNFVRLRFAEKNLKSSQLDDISKNSQKINYNNQDLKSFSKLRNF